jgi:hypothetical protein
MHLYFILMSSFVFIFPSGLRVRSEDLRGRNQGVDEEKNILIQCITFKEMGGLLY